MESDGSTRITTLGERKSHVTANFATVIGAPDWYKGLMVFTIVYSAKGKAVRRPRNGSDMPPLLHYVT